MLHISHSAQSADKLLVETERAGLYGTRPSEVIDNWLKPVVSYPIRDSVRFRDSGGPDSPEWARGSLDLH